MDNKNMHLILIVAVALGLSACSSKDGGNESRDENGNCTQSYNEDYNAVRKPFKELQELRDEDRLPASEVRTRAEAIQQACVRFFAKHSGVVCRARDLNGGDTRTIRSSRVKSDCERIEAYLNNAEGGAPADTPTAPPTEGTPLTPDESETTVVTTVRPELEKVKIQTTFAEFKAEIVKPEPFSKMASDTQTAAVYGQLYDYSSLVSVQNIDKATVCAMAYSPAPGAEPFKVGQTYSQMKSQEVKGSEDGKPYRLLTLFVDPTIKVSCTKFYSVDSGFEWSEVQSAFGEILKFSKK